MILDVNINGVSLYELGWIRENVDFPTPQSQTNTIVVPGRNAPIRYTEALGRVSYQPRSFTLTFSMHGTRAMFDERVSIAVNRFAGKLAKVICSDRSDVFAVGTLEAAPAYDPLAYKGQLVLSCTDGDAYLYHVDETIVSVTGGGRVTLWNDFMPVVPIIKTTEETEVSWKIGEDVFRKSISAGTWEFPEMELQEGENQLTITGNGVTVFKYREGRL